MTKGLIAVIMQKKIVLVVFLLIRHMKCYTKVVTGVANKI